VGNKNQRFISMNLVDEENLDKLCLEYYMSRLMLTLHLTLLNIDFRLLLFQLFVGVVDFLEIVDRHDDDDQSPDETPGGITI
jgi:hypothetical protein